MQKTSHVQPRPTIRPFDRWIPHGDDSAGRAGQFGREDAQTEEETPPAKARACHLLQQVGYRKIHNRIIIIIMTVLPFICFSFTASRGACLLERPTVPAPRRLDCDGQRPDCRDSLGCERLASKRLCGCVASRANTPDVVDRTVPTGPASRRSVRLLRLA